MKQKSEQRRDLLIRLAGLLYVGLLAALMAACGLTLAFGRYYLSIFFFFAAAAMLAFIKVLQLIIR